MDREKGPFAEAWHQHKGYLINIAYRLIGSLSESEDMVQEAYARLLRADLDDADDVRGWLVVVVTRLCLDQLRSERTRHETNAGPWFPEPLVQLSGQQRSRGHRDPGRERQDGSLDRAGADDAGRARCLRPPRRLRLFLRGSGADGRPHAGRVPSAGEPRPTAH